VAIDVDPEAVAAAVENRDRNGVGGRVVCAAAPVAAIAGRFDLVTANIQADVLGSLRESIVERTAPEGTVILSGLLSDEAEAVGAAYATLPGCRLAGLRRLADDPEWSCVVIERAGARP
jgi:ribosomal protein L11 methyltransferase